MGAWGYKSYDNDAVMDEIPVSLGEPTKLQMEKTLKKVFNPSKRFYSGREKMEVRLGVVVYFLNISEYPNTVIDKQYLKRALTCAHNLKNDKIYLANWKGTNARKNQLNKEIQLIRKAKGL